MALTKIDISLMENTGTTANKLLVYDGSGNLPAVDASQLTNVSTGITESSSDPTISTNPAGGVGTEWMNTTSGEVYICTDATAGANVWTNVGAGSGDVAPWSYQGDAYAYSQGGQRDGASTSNVIDRWSLTTDGNAVDVGDLTQATQSSTGSSDGDYGYVSAGQSGTTVDSVERFAFGSSVTCADIGTLSVGHNEDPGGSYTATRAYIHNGGGTNVIERFAFGSSVTGVDVGDAVWSGNGHGGANSPTYGYIAGGSSTAASNIQKYSYAATANSVDVGNLVTSSTYVGENANSQTHGYIMGGHNGAYLNVIQKWAYSSDSNSTDVGNLLYTGNSTQGAASATHAYCVGGGNASSQFQNIQKVPFATDGDSTNVGTLSGSSPQTSMCSVNQP